MGKHIRKFWSALCIAALVAFTANAQAAGLSASEADRLQAAAAKGDAAALTRLKQGAQAGGAKSQFDLGFLYEQGQGVKQDYVQALLWYRKAAAQGGAVAQTNIGGLYADGNGVKQDYAQAALWYRKAAGQGYARAQNNLGTLYAIGSGVMRNYAQAALWYRKAAVQGLAPAQNNLGGLYAHGEGVPRNSVIAWAFYNIATGAFKVAAVFRGALEKQMNPKEIAAAQALSLEMAKPGNLLKALDAYLAHHAAQ